MAADTGCMALWLGTDTGEVIPNARAYGRLALVR
jgi:hypothetical protein